MARQLNCSCKNFEPFFFDAIRDSFMPKGGQPLREDEKTLLSKLDNLAEGCGYELNSEGHYELFPEQDRALRALGSFTITEEHDDGDLTIDTKDYGKLIVTTEGEIFYSRKM